MHLKSKDLMILSILTFLTILAWIGFEAYHTAVTSTVPKNVEILSQPLSPELRVEVVDKLQSP